MQGIAIQLRARAHTIDENSEQLVDRNQAVRPQPLVCDLWYAIVLELHASHA